MEKLFGRENQGYKAEDEDANFNLDPRSIAQTTEAAQDNNNHTLLHPFVVWYFVSTGQWFEPVRLYLESKLNWTPSTTKVCRFLYAAWQAIVVVFMWAFFVYSMGFMGLRTLQEVDWLCPLTDIKNMVYGFSWIVNHHTGLIFFLMGTGNS